MAFFEMQAKSESRMSTDEWIARIPPSVSLAEDSEDSDVLVVSLRLKFI